MTLTKERDQYRSDQLIKNQIEASTPRKPFTVVLPLGAKKGTPFYEEVPIWQLLCWILILVGALFTVNYYGNLEGMKQYCFYIISVTVIAIVFAFIIIKCRKSSNKFFVSVALVLSLSVAVPLYMDIPYIDNYANISLVDIKTEVRKTYHIKGGFRTTYRLIGYTTEGEKIKFNITKNQYREINTSGLNIDYLPNSKTLIAFRSSTL